MLVKCTWNILFVAFALAICLENGYSEETEKKAEPKKAAASEATKDADKKSDADAKKSASQKKEENKGEAKPAEEEKVVDSFAVPKGGTGKEMVNFIKKIASKAPPRAMPARIEHFTKLATAVLEASEKALADEELEVELAVTALAFRFRALDLQRQLEIEGASKAELELAKKYSTDKREQLAEMAQEKLLTARLHSVKDLKPEEQSALVEEAVKAITSKGKPSIQSVQKAMEIGNTLEEAEQPALAGLAFEKFGEFLKTSDDEEVSRYGVKFNGIARRLRLKGNAVEIDGETAEGKAFDWAAYQGKVVLVDFWATWCGPCIAELPNVKHNYAGYHSKGFEVVGISLDKDLDRLQSFIKKNNIPWSNLFSADEKNTGWDHPLAVKYGVMGIPFTMLVGKDGKVIEMNVRGPKLGKLLGDLLGEPDAEALKAASEAEEAANNAEEGDAKPAPKKTDNKKSTDTKASE